HDGHSPRRPRARPVSGGGAPPPPKRGAPPRGPEGRAPPTRPPRPIPAEAGGARPPDGRARGGAPAGPARAPAGRGPSSQHGYARQPPREGYLATHGLEKSFGNRKVVRGPSIYVRRGEAVGRLGPDGGGQATGLQMI